MSFKKILTGFVTAAILIATLFGTMIPALAATDATSAADTTSAAADATSATTDESSAPAATTGESLIITVSDASVSPGNTIEVTVSMKGKNVASFEGELKYDQDALQIENIEDTDQLSNSGLIMFHQDKETQEFLSGAFAYASPDGADLDGVVLKITFLAKDNANGKYDFQFENLAAFDEKINALTPQVDHAGSITVGTGLGGQSAGAGTSNFLIILIIALSVVVIAVIVIIIVVVRKKNARRPYYEAPAHYSEDE